MWRTGELAKYLGIDRSVLHYYDAEGVIRAKKGENNYRAYDAFDLIALCEARHLRSMGFPLDETAELLRSADLSAKGRALEAREREVDREIKRLETVKYLIGSFQGRHRPVPRQRGVLAPYDYGGYYYLPLESGGSSRRLCRDYEGLAALVKEAPFVNYCFHFPPGSCCDPARFQYEFGVSFQEWWRELAPEVLPRGMEHLPPRRALFTLMEIEDRESLFRYEDFAFAREHCAREGLPLTGEVMAFPTMQFYEDEAERALASVFFFLEEEKQDGKIS